MIKKDKLLLIPLIIIAINLLLFFSILGLLFFSFKYPYVENFEALLKIFLYSNIPACLAIVYIPVYLILRRWLKKWMKITLTVIITILIFFTFQFSLRFMLIMGTASPFASQTNDVNNYLKVDRYVEEVSKIDIFPKEIPDAATNVHYFYRYRHIIEADYDVYLKTNLPKEEFQKEKERIVSQYPNVEIVKKENGYVDYRVAFDHPNSYYYNFASFNEADLTVMYTVSYSLEGDTVGDIPYFKENAEI